MPVLVYCLAEAQPLQVPGKGVADLPIESLERAGLKCYFSQIAANEDVLAIPAKEAALAFHSVIQALFHQAAIIPFRYPTILPSESDCLRHISDHNPPYYEVLAGLRNLIQMEIHLSHRGVVADKDANKSTSGIQYLKSRQADQRELRESAAHLRALGEAFAREWRERLLGKELCCFALIERQRVTEFKKRVAAIQLASNVLARVTGPWPATEFIDKV